ncbi:methyltransferase domain-containing protein [uncultured Desulfobulbus sp.]|uniref:class I SAM-dependent methyltransferase n=1 Tax=uncultured Desulfobulbus sp. TaxID=239745 RepID=UPI0029C64A31|nr:methyltransferase domain-containing protein [uncultured Desulfobulbus sp.]
MKNKRQYQNDLSLQSPILLDFEYKQVKVQKMLSVLKDAGMVSDNRNGLAVDIGCSGGFFTYAITPYFHKVVGLDIDTHAIKLANKKNSIENLSYLIGDSLNLPFADKSVDLIICNHVYEHVPDPEKMFCEIYRVLSDNGGCYLGAASRLTLIEPHYHLPLLSWLPKPFAHWYLRAFSKGEYYYEDLRSCGGILKLIRRFNFKDYTLEIITDPDKFYAYDLLPVGGGLRKIPIFIWKIFYKLLPTYIFILKRQRQRQ